MIASDAVKRAFARWQPARPPLTHRAFAKLTLLPGGPLEGTAYDPATDPVQDYFCAQLDSGVWESMTWCAPPQIAGKTQIGIIVPALRAALELRAAVGYGLPTLHDLDRGWQTKIAPTIRKAGFGDYLPQKGPGSKHGRPPSIAFEDPKENRAGLGSFVFLAGAARQVTVRVVVIDELDAWRTADGAPRWTDIEDCWARADSFQSDAIRIGTGTIECDDPKQSIVLPLVNERGTGTRCWQKCPHCAAYAPSDFDRLSYEYRVTDGGPDLGHAAATAAYACPSCSVRWSENDRRAALLSCRFAHKGQTVDASGQVVGKAPSTRHLGLRTTALDCILTTMAAIAEKHASARYAVENHGNHDPMRKFTRYQRVECYTGDQQQDDDATATLTHAILAERSKRTAWSSVFENKDEAGLWSRYWAEWPDAATFAVPAIDVQHNRLYFTATAFASDERTWDIGWGQDYAHAGSDRDKPAPFGPGELHATLDRLADWLEGQMGDRMRLGVIDTGDQGDELGAWLANRPRWRGCRGIDTLPRIRIDGSEQSYESRIDGLVCWEKKWKPGLGRYVISSEGSWRAFQSAMRRKPGDPGAAHLPGPLKAGTHYLRHLTAQGEVKNKAGASVWRVQPGGGRHDLGDCRGYAHAVGLALLRCPKPKEAAQTMPTLAFANDPFMRAF